MTELETMQRAKMYLEKLAQGIDPISGEEMEQDAVLNNVRLARCFFYVSGILDQVIANGGKVGTGPKSNLPDFQINREQLARVPISFDPLRITQFVTVINDVVNDPTRKKLSAGLITNWLLSKGLLMNMPADNGKNKRVPTEAGIKCGLSTEQRQGQYGLYTAVLYNGNAQRFILDHLPELLQSRENHA